MVKTPVVSSKTRVMVYVLKRLSWRRRPLNLAQRNLITITPPLLPLGEMGAKSIVQSRCRLPSSWQARPRAPYNYPHSFRMKVTATEQQEDWAGQKLLPVYPKWLFD